MKTLNEWRDSKYNTIQEYLKVGDIVDENMVDYFLNILPPIRWSRNFIQVGEVSDFINGRNTYMTFEREEGKWKYCGDCYVGSSTNVA